MRVSAMALLAPLALGLPVPALAESAVPYTRPALLGQFILPTGLICHGVAFGGISGLDYDAARGVYYAISDDRSQKGPARFYVLKLGIDGKGLHSVDIAATHDLTGLDGKPFAEKSIDPEAMRLAPDGQSLFWSSEGDAKGQPAVYQADLEGHALRMFAVPAAYLPDAEKTRGIYNNLAFESLAVSPDGKTLYTGTESALRQDGAKATLVEGSPSRILAFDIGTGQPVGEYLYQTAPIAMPATAAPGYNDNGLSAFETLPDGRFVTVERTYASGVGNDIRFFISSLGGATDINGEMSVRGETVQAADKRLWFEIGEGDYGLDIDNIESFTWGPEIDGKKTFVIASDNNFNPNGQFTQFVVFTYADK